MDVLVADDREDDLSLAVEALHGLYRDDCHITQATRLSYAKHLLREHTYDLIILDLTYPDSLADETWYSIRPLVRESSVIIYSAYIDERLMLHLLYAGVQHFIDKANYTEETRNAFVLSIQREVIKLMAMRTHQAIEPSRKDLMDRMADLETQVRQIKHVVYEGNGDSLITQLRVMGAAIQEVRGDITEIKPQVGALAQAKIGWWTVIVTAVGATLAALIGPWLKFHLGGP